jgi:hypothetical protein
MEVGKSKTLATALATSLIAMVLRGPPSSKFVGFEQHRSRLLVGRGRKKNIAHNK